MYYKPQTLEVKAQPTIVKNELGYAVQTDTPDFVAVCGCRADKQTDTEITTETGQTIRPSYHIVCERRNTAKIGDTIRVKRDGNIIVEGVVKQYKDINYYDYSEIWI